MRLLFKQRFFSWFDSYDIYDEDGNTVFTVEGKLAWGNITVASARNSRSSPRASPLSAVTGR